MLMVLIGLVASQPEVVAVKRVLSSNTVVVATASDPSLYVHLAGVGTPETSDARKPTWMLGKADPGGLAAYLLVGTKVGMTVVGETSTGRPSVVLTRLEDGMSWNRWLVESGAGFFATTTLVDFSREEEAAQQARRGLWKDAPGRASGSERSRREVTIQSFSLANYPDRRFRKRYAPQPDLLTPIFEAMASEMMTMTMSSGGGGGYDGRMMPVNPNQQTVQGYTRRDGTYVNSYRRTMANGTTLDNFGSR